MPGNKNSGRKKKPSALKELEGNPGKRAKEAEHEPPHNKTAPRAPAWLTKNNSDAAKLFNRLSKLLHGMGLLSASDVQMLSAYCDVWVCYCECQNLVKEEGYIIIEYGREGQRKKQNPAISAARGYLADAMRLASCFGFTPADRIVKDEGSGEEDPLMAMAKAREVAFENMRKRQEALKKDAS